MNWGRKVPLAIAMAAVASFMIGMAVMSQSTQLLQSFGLKVATTGTPTSLSPGGSVSTSGGSGKEVAIVSSNPPDGVAQTTAGNQYVAAQTVSLFMLERSFNEAQRMCIQTGSTHYCSELPVLKQSIQTQISSINNQLPEGRLVFYEPRYSTEYQVMFKFVS